MYTPPFKSDLFYSVQNEDYQTELAVLRRVYQGTPLRVLMVAFSGVAIYWVGEDSLYKNEGSIWVSRSYRKGTRLKPSC